MSDEFDFSGYETVEIPVTTPEGDKCVLRQASGGAAVKYRAKMMGGMKMSREGEGKEGKMKIGGDIGSMAASEPLLISLCLFYTEGSNEGNNVSLSVVESWPNTVMKKLYKKAKDISDLDESEDEDTVGNESGGTPSGSG